jgi:translocation and assembly module TamB
VQEPTQIGVRYRVNDNILLRGTTNFEGDSRAVVEFETRF